MRWSASFGSAQVEIPRWILIVRSLFTKGKVTQLIRFIANDISKWSSTSEPLQLFPTHPLFLCDISDYFQFQVALRTFGTKRMLRSISPEPQIIRLNSDDCFGWCGVRSWRCSLGCKWSSGTTVNSLNRLASHDRWVTLLILLFRDIDPLKRTERLRKFETVFSCSAI